ncbi:peptidoglycan recognition protein family protein [Acrocarpospora catenulata]|uniref:peptidoglycan recognition protein family protein n=1 Tax=Acrocarpospora catenulata TaxID=2836182 RepID=UPI001BDAED0E|nr:N-acetylmuramoyl-L-alanine amidase [Acrocarpospora catenulata]
MAIDLVTRNAWGARAPKGSYSPLSSTRGVKVHYTGGRVDPAIVNDHNKCVEMVKSIQNFHMDGNGWIDIGYSMIACPHRKVFVGRGPRHVPAANGSGLNSAHYAVLGLVGNAGLIQPTDTILHAILDAIEYLRAEGGAGREIKGHRDGYSTDCPGEPLYKWVQQGAPRPGGGGSTPTDPTTPAWPGRLLTYPPVMRGDDVRTWQAQMKRLGFTLDADGAYGQQSRNVCKTFQRRVNLEDDGVVGRLTWEASFKAKP